jgi:L-threonylcarbamoyladenylate synthase
MKKLGRSNDSLVEPASAAAVEKAAALIAQGGIVALPTETSYGLAVDPFNEKALSRLFKVKQRPPSKPILVLIDHIAWLSRLVAAVPDCYQALFTRHWPGPLTLIFPALPHLSPLLTGGTTTIGIRISSDPFARDLCRATGGPISATSANISGAEPALSVPQIIDQFGDTLDLIIDDGVRATGPNSTVVTQVRGELQLIRAGRIDFSSLNA